MNKLRVLDLFSGIGGFSLGLERTGGFETVAFCEISAPCRHLLAHHWPGVPIYDDVRSLTADRLAADGVAVEAICAGFPCQDLSFAGKGAGLAGERSGLFFEIVRLAGEIAAVTGRLPVLVLENVSALLVRGFGTVAGELAALGYDLWWDCIPASAVGAPHRRDRIWIVAYPGGEQHEGRCDAFRRAIAAGLHASDADREGEHDVALDAEVGVAPEPVADAARLQSGRPEQRAQRERTGASGEPVPHPRRALDDTVRGRHRAPEGEIRAGRHGAIGASWWLSEPDVGRVAHGVPAILDGTHGADEEHDPQASAQGNGAGGGVPSLWGAGAAGAASSQLRDAGRGRGALPSVPCEGGSAGRHAEGEGDEVLHDLRGGVPADAQQEAHDLQPGVSGRSWPTKRGEALGHTWRVEPDVPRVAHGVAARVDRLHGLGNAVVPQIPEVIGRAILRLELQAFGERRAA